MKTLATASRDQRRLVMEGVKGMMIEDREAAKNAQG